LFSVASRSDVPEDFVTIDMLMRVAKSAPGRLVDNFPVRFRTKMITDKIIAEAPDAEKYVKSILQK